MTNDSSELPIFPTSAPAVFCDPDITQDLFSEVLQRLAAVVDIDEGQREAPTPCKGLNAGELQSHVLGWLEFFAAALSDPAATNSRPDPEAFVLANDTQASDIVRGALADIRTAIAADAAGGQVTMTSARMAGDGVLGMALGEYIIHAWDLSSATDRSYSAPDSVVDPAHEFLTGMIAPEYRGPDSGFFDAEIAVPESASPLDKLLGFAGRDPQWTGGTYDPANNRSRPPS